MKSVEVAEKSLKLNVSTYQRRPDTLSSMMSPFGHNIDKLRHEAATHNPVFDDDDIRQFTKTLDNKRGSLLQKLRYGAESTTSGYSADIAELAPVVDKIFYCSMLRLPVNDKKMTNAFSPIYRLLHGEYDNTRNPDMVLEALRNGSEHFEEYKDYCTVLKANL